MYCIIVYDVEQKRVGKVLKFLRRYLFWVQNSVFEGEVRESDFLKIKKGMERLIDKQKDSIIIFSFDRPKWIKKEIIGIEKGNTSQFV